jgi:hypothetical protein
MGILTFTKWRVVWIALALLLLLLCGARNAYAGPLT